MVTREVLARANLLRSEIQCLQDLLRTLGFGKFVEVVQKQRDGCWIDVEVVWNGQQPIDIVRNMFRQSHKAGELRRENWWMLLILAE